MKRTCFPPNYRDLNGVHFWDVSAGHRQWQSVPAVNLHRGVGWDVGSDVPGHLFAPIHVLIRQWTAIHIGAEGPSH